VPASSMYPSGSGSDWDYEVVEGEQGCQFGSYSFALQWQPQSVKPTVRSHPRGSGVPGARCHQSHAPPPIRFALRSHRRCVCRNVSTEGDYESRTTDQNGVCVSTRIHFHTSKKRFSMVNGNILPAFSFILRSL
jgi:hypothetical protein